MEILKFGLSAIRKLRSPGILPLSDTWRLVNAVRKVKFKLLQINTCAASSTKQHTLLWRRKAAISKPSSGVYCPALDISPPSGLLLIGYVVSFGRSCMKECALSSKATK